MGNLSLRPAVWAQVVSAGLPTSAPTALPHIFEADTAVTLAPAIGQARLLIGDPDGKWAKTLRPNDYLGITFNSRARQRVTALAAPLPGPAIAPTPGTSAPATGNTWTGLIDEVFEAKDPTSRAGRACLINASTLWKLLATTAVPMYRFATGVYPLPGTPTQALFEAAIFDVAKNTGITIPADFEPTAIHQMTPPNQVPSNFTDPTSQSWASFVLGLGVIGGLEVYFDESGTLQVRSPKYMRNIASAVIADEETFQRQAGGSDRGLVTNVVVGYTVVPLTTHGVEAPAGGITQQNSGPLPATLKAPDGTPLKRLGQRFISLQVPQIQNPADAGYYAATVRQLGLAGGDQAELSAILNGDLRIGTIAATPGNGKRYYVSTVQHSYRFGQQAVTQVSGRFGIGLDKMWDRSGLDGPLAWDYVTLPGYPTDPLSTDGRTNAHLPPVADDPSVLITSPTLTVTDILASLSGHTPPSPFYDQAGYIATEAAHYGIDPSFALAVWMVETQLGSDGSAGSKAFNPGNLGPFIVYPNWQAGIDAWFATIAGSNYVGAGLTTVSAIGARYAPAADGNANWVTDVDSIMRSIRQNATLPTTPAVPSAPQPPAGSVRDKVIQAAKTQLGLPYLMGGYAPGVTWDCSALMQWAYGQAGLSIPRTAQTQYDASGPLTEDQIIPGDLVFFQHTYETSDRITHVGLALGGGQMLDAQSGGVQIESYQTAYWSPLYVGAGRPSAIAGK